MSLRAAHAARSSRIVRKALDVERLGGVDVEAKSRDRRDR